MTDSWRDRSPADVAPASGAGLLDVLRRQHADLDDELSRIPELTGFAQLDVCLHVRRRMAVHAALERSLVTRRPADEPPSLERLVLAAEKAEAGGVEADIAAAWARVRDVFVQHAELVERAALDRDGELDARERATVAEALRLWEGRTDAYLGHEYTVMIGVALEQLAESAARA